jgi:uncharacterized protein YbjQ (UPF0145 family)
MNRVLLAVVVCFFTFGPVASAQVEIRSADGRRSVTAYDNGRVMYQSANGILEVEATKTGFRVGDFSLEATDVTRTAAGVKMRLAMSNGGTHVSDVIEVNTTTGAMTGARLGQLRKMFRDFAKTSDGFLLNEARELIVQNLQNEGRQVGANGGMGSEWSTYSCGMDILNATAAGAAMVGGCTTGTVWCVSGVSWYAASLMAIAGGTNCVFM